MLRVDNPNPTSALCVYVNICYLYSRLYGEWCVHVLLNGMCVYPPFYTMLQVQQHMDYISRHFLATLDVFCFIAQFL